MFGSSWEKDVWFKVLGKEDGFIPKGCFLTCENANFYVSFLPAFPVDVVGEVVERPCNPVRNQSLAEVRLSEGNVAVSLSHISLPLLGNFSNGEVKAWNQGGVAKGKGPVKEVGSSRLNEPVGCFGLKKTASVFENSSRQLGPIVISRDGLVKMV